jgi:hypothetical protein
MMADLDESVPPYAAAIWHDGTNLYLRLPDSGYITKLPFTEAALSKGLKLIRAKAKVPSGHAAKVEAINNSLKGHVARATKPSRKPAARFDEGTRAAVRDILRRAGK